MKLEEPRKLQNVFKSNLNEISNKTYKSEKKKLLYFTNHKKLLLHYLITILQLYLRLNTKRFTEI